MLVIVGQSFRFKTETEGEINVSPSPAPQEVTASIKYDPLYELATSDGSLVEIQLADPEADTKTKKK